MISQSIQATVSKNAVNLIGEVTADIIKMLQWADYSVVRQEGASGYLKGSYTVPLDPERNWDGVQSILKARGIVLKVTAAA